MIVNVTLLYSLNPGNIIIKSNQSDKVPYSLTCKNDKNSIQLDRNHIEVLSPLRKLWAFPNTIAFFSFFRSSSNTFTDGFCMTDASTPASEAAFTIEERASSAAILSCEIRASFVQSRTPDHAQEQCQQSPAN